MTASFIPQWATMSSLSIMLYAYVAEKVIDDVYSSIVLSIVDKTEQL
jgi:hypothetical protein